MRHQLLLLLTACVAAATSARGQVQEPGPARTGARIDGTVRDSLAGGAPLAGAHVQLAAADGTNQVVRTADSDARGRFVLDRVPDGRYRIGFLHPVLDSLGLEPPLREIIVERARSLTVDLGTPSPARLRAAVCGAAWESAPALLTGVVRRASDHVPVAGAVVTGEWLEIALRRDAVRHRLAHASDTTGQTGRFALCHVPSPGTVVIAAAHGEGDTDRIEVEITPRGFVRRDLYVGEVRVEQLPPAAGRDSAGDTTSTPTVRRVGDGRLRGTVVTAEGARPIPGAQVAIAVGARTTSDASGDWTLSGIPSGTRDLEVRAVGHAPRRIPVDVVPGAAPVRVALATTGALLDTVRVTASRSRLQGTGFEERRRRGIGRYLTAEDMTRGSVVFTSDVLHMVPGMRVDRTPLGDATISMQGGFGRCAPAVYIDGQHMPGFSAGDIDAWVLPEDVAGIEIYDGAFVPPEFQPGMTGCGSLVIWTKVPSDPAPRRSMWRRVIHGLAAVLLGAGIGVLVARR